MIFKRISFSFKTQQITVVSVLLFLFLIVSTILIEILFQSDDEKDMTAEIIFIITGFLTFISILIWLTRSKNLKKAEIRFKFIKYFVQLSSIIIKNNEVIDNNELIYFEEYLKSKNLGKLLSNYKTELENHLKNELNLNKICNRIYYELSINEKTRMLHQLFCIANSDEKISENQINILNDISRKTGINQTVFKRIKSMFVVEKQFDDFFNTFVEIPLLQQNRSLSYSYSIIGVSEDSTNEEIKKAYRNLVKIHHPDKVEHLGKEFVEESEKMFEKIQSAYDTILSEREKKS
jgi:DnaJ like chaperone protein